MRDPERIDRILTLIRKAWTELPDMRLGQLIINMAGPTDHLWHLEDDVLEDAVREWLDTSKNWQPR